MRDLTDRVRRRRDRTVWRTVLIQRR